MSTKAKIYQFYLKIRHLFRVNLVKTVLINFKLLKFKQAIKFPIYAYGKIHIDYIKTKAQINGPLKKGMIRFGYRWFDLPPDSFLPTQIKTVGKLIFNGPALIGGGVSIVTKGYNSIIELGKNVTIGSGCIIKSLNKLLIGDNTCLVYGCTIMTSNMHYIKDIDSGKIMRNNGNIVIGKNCWINSGTFISKDSVIPDFSITSRGALINKDYSSFGTNLMLVGSPAKPLDKKIQRIFNCNKEYEISKKFEEHKGDPFIVIEEGIDIDDNMTDDFILDLQ